MSKLPDFSNMAPHYDSVSVPSSGKRASYRAPLPPYILRWSVLGLDILCAMLVTHFYLQREGIVWLDVSVRDALPYFMISVSALLGLSAGGAYRLSFRHTIHRHMLRTAVTAGAGVLIWASLLVLFSGDLKTYSGLMGLVWGITLPSHLAYVLLTKRLSKAGYLCEKVVIIGATPRARNVITRNIETGEMNVLGIFDDRHDRAPADIEGVPVLGDLDNLMDWERLPEIDRIIVTVTSNAHTRVQDMIEQLRVLPQDIVLLLDTSAFTEGSEERTTRIGGVPGTYVSGAPGSAQKEAIKRLVDIVFGACLLIGFAPIMLVCALLIKLEDGGPVFFKQMRHGFNNELIRVWKFRSMRPDKLAAAGFITQTVADDPRITNIGRIIRATSIDELPQLFNVLAGQMSLVGPRPHAIGMTTESTHVYDVVAEYAHRHRVKPGLTGWAQINGSRGPVHTREDVRERVRLDMEYLKRSSFFFDLRIMLLTLPCLLGDRKNTR